MKKILVTIPVREKDRKFLEEKGKEFQFCYRTKEEITVSDVVDAEIILGNIPVELVPKAKKLKFLQLDSAGSTEYTASGVLMPDTKLANATGAYGLAISEYMLAGVLMLRKKLHLYQKNMEQHLWKDEGEVLSIRDSVTLVVGLGDIGSQFAEKMHALGSEVIGVRKHKAAGPDYIKEVCQQEDLDRLLPKADIVACCMPGTGETAGMFDLERMKKMKPGAILINVGRGSLIPGEALKKMLVEGHLGGAILDVTEEEPLSADSPLWDLPNLLITPHVSGNYHMRQILDTVVKIAGENLEAFLDGKELVNEVDLCTGYRKFKA